MPAWPSPPLPATEVPGSRTLPYSPPLCPEGYGEFSAPGQLFSLNEGRKLAFWKERIGKILYEIRWGD